MPENYSSRQVAPLLTARLCTQMQAPSHLADRDATTVVEVVAPVCRNHKKHPKGAGKGAPRKAHQVDADQPEETTTNIDDDMGIYTSTATKSPPAPPIQVDLQLNGRMQLFEVDTGAAVSLMPHSTFGNCFQRLDLVPQD